MIFYPTLVRYEQPTLQLSLVNPTGNTINAYLGGGAAFPYEIANYGQIFTNPMFEQASIGWTPSAGWVFGVGGATYTVPLVPDNSNTIGQILNGLTVGRQYSIKVRVNFSAPFTGNMQVLAPLVLVPLAGVVGEFVYEGTVTATTNFAQFFGVQFDSVAPTLAGTQITLLEISVLDINNPDVQLYQQINAQIKAFPVRMHKTRLLWGNIAQQNSPIEYGFEDISGETQNARLPIITYRDPNYSTVYQNVLDFPKVSYLLAAQYFLRFVLPPYSVLIYSSDVKEQVSLYALNT
jgi:hypothetical protein